MTKKLYLTGMAIAIAMSASMPAFAEDEYNVSNGVTTAGVPLGLHGVDAVALTTYNAVAEGDAAHTVVEDGVAYYFPSAESARKFKTDPVRFAPQYGGFCAYAVALGKKFDGDPHYADIVDGKLYLFVNADVFEKYKKDKVKRPGHPSSTRLLVISDPFIGGRAVRPAAFFPSDIAGAPYAPPFTSFHSANGYRESSPRRRCVERAGSRESVSGLYRG